MIHPPDMNAWTGRVDAPAGPETARWHQIVMPLKPESVIVHKPSFAFLGFRSDEGIRRNQGRIGAVEGPKALRRALTNLPAHFKNGTSLFEAGDVACEKGNLEEAHKELATQVEELVKRGMTPVVLGGGHEVAYGHYLGLRNAAQAGPGKKKIGVINFDAHFDLRPYDQGSHSGSPFLEIADLCKKNGEGFSYLCLGIQASSNTRFLFNTAEKLGVTIVPGPEVHISRHAALVKTVDQFLADQDAVYVTFCLDVLAAAFAPGVSAPTPHGILPDVALALVRHIAATKKVLGFDVAELSPPLDQDGRTAKLAAAIVFEFVTAFA